MGRVFESVLELSNYPILADNGKVSALAAKLKAETEFDVFRGQQDTEYVSDFDRVVAECQRQAEEEGMTYFKTVQNKVH